MNAERLGRRLFATFQDIRTEPYKARVLRDVSLVLLVMAGALLLFELVLNNITLSPAMLAATGLVLAAGLAGQWLSRLNRVALGAQVVVVLLLLWFLLNAFWGRASVPSLFISFGILVLCAGLLGGTRWAFGMTLVGIVGVALSLMLAQRSAGSGLATLDWTAAQILPIIIQFVAFVFLLNLAFAGSSASRADTSSDRTGLRRFGGSDQRVITERARALALAAEVGRELTRAMDVESLLRESAALIRERFGLYHVQIYLLNPSKEELVLRAATGDEGSELMALGHRLPIGPGSIVGAAAATGRPVVVPRAEESPLFLPSTLLPQTRSELAMPMLIEDDVIGVLDLQSATSGALNADGLEPFAIVAAQLATAIENARLFRELNATREELSRQAEALRQESWQRLLQQEPGSIVLQHGTVVEVSGDPAVTLHEQLTQPIIARGATIGEIALGTSAMRTDVQKQELVGAVAEQLGSHLENLRLTRQAEAALAEARRREEEMALVSRVVSAVAASTHLPHSLQIIVDQLSVATAVGQVGIALLNDRKTALTVVADRSERLNSPTAVGIVIPLADNPASQQAINERRPVIVQDATNNPLTASAHEVLRQRGVKSIVILPLVAGNEVIGTVGLDVVDDEAELTEDQLRLAQTIVYQAASAVQRARLFNQTEMARRDAERLYSLSAALNAAQDMDGILRAIIHSGLVQGASGASLSTVAHGSDGRPDWAEVIASWSAVTRSTDKSESSAPISEGTRFRVPELLHERIWSTRPTEPVLVGNVTQDEGMTENVREMFAALGGRSMLILPLSVREHWIGLITISWNEKRTLVTHDRRLFRTAATQLAVAFSNQQLFDQERVRAAQLESLARIETGLSVATTEDEIVLALAHGAVWPRLQTLTLGYLSTRASDGTLLAEVVSRYQAGNVVPVSSTPVPLRVLPLSTLWLDSPRDALIIEDSEADARVTEAVRTQARQEGWRALALVPLWRGGQWQGYVSFAWAEPHRLSANERFLLQRMVEPVAATVASRRAYLAQRAALSQTEALYNVSARLNMAQSFHDVLLVVRRYTELGRQANVVQLAHFDRPWQPDRVPGSVVVIGQRPGDRTTPIQHYKVEDFGLLRLLRSDRPTIFTDVEHDPRLDRASRAALQEPPDVKSAIFAPLVVAGQWIGYVSLLFQQQARTFSEQEVEALSVLVSQVAVAAQTILLLEQTRRLLESEQRQRRIADTLLDSARIMSESLDESFLRDKLLEQFIETLPDAVAVNLYEWLPESKRFILERGLDHPVAPLSPIAPMERKLGKRFSTQARPELWEVFSSGASAVLPPSEDVPGERYCITWRIGREPAGVIEVIRAGAAPGRRPVPLTVDDERRCEGIVQQAALAIQNAQSFGRLEAALGAQARLSAELRTVSDVSIAAAASLAIDPVLEAAVDLTKESFGLYHAHIYLMDDEAATLVLRAGAGEVGRRMVAEGREIPLRANSIVARAARERDVVLVADTRSSNDFLPHPLLPDTRSEMAVPMIAGERLVGVLDVQADTIDRFGPDDVQVHRILASQLAVAIQNAYYYAEQLDTAEKLREVDRLKTEFLARMSHELRTPLNSIIGFTDVLLMGIDGELNERMTEDLRLIRAGGHHLRDIIGDLLDMSRIEAGRLELTYETFDIRRVTGELMAAAAPLAEQKGLNLNLEVADDVGPLVADRTRIRQVLWNIIGNAIKFTEQGDVSVSVRRDNGTVVFTVADTGVGITPEQLPYIFERFRQVDSAQHETTGGTGLGLSISRSLVELHGGDLTVDSEPGRGSIFRFSIPVSPAGRA